MRTVRLDAEERRAAIIEAALPLFARKGFSGVLTKELAQAAGVSEALLYKHFPSKQAIYEGILALGHKEAGRDYARCSTWRPRRKLSSDRSICGWRDSFPVERGETVRRGKPVSRI